MQFPADMQVVARAEQIELAAVRDIFAAAPADLAAERGIETASFGVTTCTAVRALPVVSVLDRVLEPAADEATIAAVCGWFDANGCTAHASLDPRVLAADVPELLERHGFEPGYAWMKFAREVDADAAAPALSEGVELVHPGAGEGAGFGEVVTAGFGLPPWVAGWLACLAGRAGWQLTLVEVDGAAAAAAGSYVAGATAWLGFGCVLPAFRGRGLQRLLLEARIAEAAALGCDLVTTETGVREPGKPGFSYGNMLAVGLREVYERPMLVRAPHA